MKMVVLTIILNSLSSIVMANLNNHSAFLEITQNDLYRVIITAKGDLSFSKSSFMRPSDGIAPEGARGFLKYKDQELKLCNDTYGYSSFDMTSSFPKTDDAVVRLKLTEAYKSDWFKISDLFRGIHLCLDSQENVIDDAFEYKVKFNFMLNGESIEIESEWKNISASTLKEL